MTWQSTTARLWQRGNCVARVNLAWCYSSGKGVDKNDVESIRLLEAAQAQVDDEWHIVARGQMGETAADMCTQGAGLRGKVMTAHDGQITAEYAVGLLEYVAGGSLRTSTRPTFNVLSPPLRVRMKYCIHPEGTSCSDRRSSACSP